MLSKYFKWVKNYENKWADLYECVQIIIIDGATFYKKDTAGYKYNQKIILDTLLEYCSYDILEGILNEYESCIKEKKAFEPYSFKFKNLVPNLQSIFPTKEDEDLYLKNQTAAG